MKPILLTVIAAATMLVAVAPAAASGGCGPAFHRGPYGRCYPNRGPVFVGPGIARIGVFYTGRGYWDGRRYWSHRDRWHDGWRYR